MNHEVLGDDYEKRKVILTDIIELLDGQLVKNVENDGYNYLDILVKNIFQRRRLALIRKSKLN